VQHTYVDSNDEPQYFKPTECEVYNEPLYGFNGFDLRWLVARIRPRLWIKGKKVGLIAEVNLDLPPWEIYMIHWEQVGLKEVAKYFDKRKKPHPDSLVADIEASQGVIPEPTKTSPPRLTPAILDILRTLGESKVRLTRERLLSAMTKAGRDRGVSTVADAMPILRNAGWVDNHQNVDPRGYAITKAGRSALKQHDSRRL
jgi:hypothetical protein